MKTVHALCRSPLVMWPPPVPDSLVVAFAGGCRKLPGPATCLLVLGRSRPQHWHQCWKEVQKVAICPLCLMSVPHEEPVLWQRLRAAAWDRRGWVSALGVGGEAVFTPAWIPYKVDISHKSLDNLVFCTYFFQSPCLFGFNI